VFATPPALASEIISYALSLLPPFSKIRFLEPGFGTGPFYSALLQQIPTSRIEVATGYEVDPYYGNPAKALWKDTGLQLYIADFTKTEPPKTESAKYNLIVCNPPYVRHHHLKPGQKRDLQAKIARYFNFKVNGLSSLYAYFLIISQAWMKKDGVGAWLIPSEFMEVNYGRAVKEFLVKKVSLCRIHRFDPREVQFGDALVSSAVVFFKNSRPFPHQKVEFTFGGTIEKPKIVSSIKLSDLCTIPKWTTLPQNISLSPKNRNHSNLTFEDLFVIKRGLATGANSFFILTPEQATYHRLPREFLKPILPSPRELETNIILADENGEPQLRNRRYLLACDLPENVVKDKYPMLWKYLERGIEAGIHKRYLCRHRKPWYLQEHRLPAPFLCTYMGRQTDRNKSPFRFILNYSKAIAANVYLLLYPRPFLCKMLENNPELFRTIWQALSSITTETLTAKGRVYGGGLYKLEPKELAKVPADIVLKALPKEWRRWSRKTKF